MNKTENSKEKVAQKLFNLHYDELCDPDKKHVREAIKSKSLLEFRK